MLWKTKQRYPRYSIQIVIERRCEVEQLVNGARGKELFYEMVVMAQFVVPRQNERELVLFPIIYVGKTQGG